MANWSDLSQDVLVCIAKLMVLVEDFLAFGLVCTSWRLAAAEENFTGSLSDQVPLLLYYPRNTKTAAKSAGELYNMRNGKTHKLNPILAKLNGVHSSSLGWLITVSEDSGVSLVHPFNHHPMVKLPNMMDKHIGVGQAWNMFALSSSPSLTSDYVVMAINNCRYILAFCRPGDDGWTIVDEEDVHHPFYHDVTCYKGQYYIVDAKGQVWVCDIEDPKQARKRVLNDHPIPVKHEDGDHQFYYLVESGGVLLAVQCTTKSFRVKDFRVFEVPFDNGDWSDSEVTNLGNKTLFLGRHSSFFVEASTYSRCKTNCIYFNQPLYGRSNFGVFTMEDRKINTDVGEYSGSLVPKFWIQPSL